MDLREFILNEGITGYIIANIKPETKRLIFPSILLLVKFEKLEAELFQKISCAHNQSSLIETRSSGCDFVSLSTYTVTIQAFNSAYMHHHHVGENDKGNKDIDDDDDDDDENIPQRLKWSGIFDFGQPKFSVSLKKKLSCSKKKLEKNDISEILSCVFSKMLEYEFKEDGYPGADGYPTVVNVLVNLYKQLAAYKVKNIHSNIFVVICGSLISRP
ncbi:unnamed protein product [Brachionus calyciflorus]|uniref:Uncharacterized protein n=1 Tax=Brachionus calyciflorus TaxID=104777 RepID=A0A814NJ91_9BILA|nr:unnamed protein product [Brachionus calyciflorus]